MSQLLSRRWFWWTLGIVIGGIAGYIYHIQVGCDSGTCKITSDPTNSTLYGSAVGALLFDGFKRKDKSIKDDRHEKTKTE